MPVLNGVTIYPSTIEENRRRIGLLIEAANGSRRFAHRAFKSTWKITWNRVLAADRDSIKALAETVSTTVFVSDEGVSYNVFIDEDAFTSDVESIGSDGTLYYNVTLNLREV